MDKKTRSMTRSCNILIAVLILVMAVPCRSNGIMTGRDRGEREMKIIFLHHSTGENIWNGGVSKWFEQYNLENKTEYRIEDRIFPKQSPYGWNNYPYDYWNIWVRNAGPDPYMEEPTLEILAGEYDVIIFKHCFPVSDIVPDTGDPEVSSDVKRLENYKLQYEALKNKMKEFPETTFIVWTAAPRVKITSIKTRIAEYLKRRSVQTENAERARTFVEWVRSEWDEPGDNIFIWDLFELATGEEIFLKKEYAEAPGNSHPDQEFSKTAAEAFCQRITDVIEGRGDGRSLTGEPEQATP